MTNPTQAKEPRLSNHLFEYRGNQIDLLVTPTIRPRLRPHPRLAEATAARVVADWQAWGSDTPTTGGHWLVAAAHPTRDGRLTITAVATVPHTLASQVAA